MNLESVASIFFDGGSGNEVFDNLFYGRSGIDISGALEHDYNWCASSSDGRCASVAGEAHGQIGSTAGGDPFVDAAGGDFHLVAPTEPGRDTYDPLDADGRTRGADGTLDRGAFEVER